VFQLPGFYYDAQKKKYFRIVPGHSNVMCGAVTPEIINSKLAQQLHNTTCQQIANQSSARNASSQNIVRLLSNRNIGRLNSICAKHCVLSNTYCSLTHQGYSKVSLLNDRYRLNHPIQLLLSSDQSQLICLWSIAYETCGLSNMIQRFDIVDVTKKDTGRTKMQLATSGYQIYRPNHISSMCLAGRHDTVRPLLYTAALMNSPVNVTSYAVIDPVTNERLDVDDSQLIPTRYQVGNMWTWACASNGMGNQFAIGTEKKCLMFDVETGHRYVLGTQKSDALSVSFAHMVS